MQHVGTFLKFRVLTRSNFAELVSEQRKLEATIAPHVNALNDKPAPGELSLLEREKACRAALDAQLLRAGLKNCEAVTCNGYEVTHYERGGQSKINGDKLALLLIEAGVDPEFVAEAISAATETGDDIKFATVKPVKGAQVRKPRTAAA